MWFQFVRPMSTGFLNRFSSQGFFLRLASGRVLLALCDGLLVVLFVWPCLAAKGFCALFVLPRLLALRRAFRLAASCCCGLCFSSRCPCALRRASCCGPRFSSCCVLLPPHALRRASSSGSSTGCVVGFLFVFRGVDDSILRHALGWGVSHGVDGARQWQQKKTKSDSKGDRRMETLLFTCWGRSLLRRYSKKEGFTL